MDGDPVSLTAEAMRFIAAGAKVYGGEVMAAVPDEVAELGRQLLLQVFGAQRGGMRVLGPLAALANDPSDREALEAVRRTVLQILTVNPEVAAVVRLLLGGSAGVAQGVRAERDAFIAGRDLVIGGTIQFCMTCDSKAAIGRCAEDHRLVCDYDSQRRDGRTVCNECAAKEDAEAARAEADLLIAQARVAFPELESRLGEFRALCDALAEVPDLADRAVVLVLLAQRSQRHFAASTNHDRGAGLIINPEVRNALISAAASVPGRHSFMSESSEDPNSWAIKGAPLVEHWRQMGRLGYGISLRLVSYERRPSGRPKSVDRGYIRAWRVKEGKPGRPETPDYSGSVGSPVVPEVPDAYLLADGTICHVPINGNCVPVPSGGSAMRASIGLSDLPPIFSAEPLTRPAIPEPMIPSIKEMTGAGAEWCRIEDGAAEKHSAADRRRSIYTPLRRMEDGAVKKYSAADRRQAKFAAEVEARKSEYDSRRAKRQPEEERLMPLTQSIRVSAWLLFLITAFLCTRTALGFEPTPWLYLLIPGTLLSLMSAIVSQTIKFASSEKGAGTLVALFLALGGSILFASRILITAVPAIIVSVAWLIAFTSIASEEE